METEYLQHDALWDLGQKMRIAGGPFAGMEGVINWIHRRRRVVRAIDAGRNFLCES